MKSIGTMDFFEDIHSMLDSATDPSLWHLVIIHLGGQAARPICWANLTGAPVAIIHTWQACMDAHMIGITAEKPSAAQAVQATNQMADDAGQSFAALVSAHGSLTDLAAAHPEMRWLLMGTIGDDFRKTFVLSNLKQEEVPGVGLLFTLACKRFLIHAIQGSE